MSHPIPFIILTHQRSGSNLLRRSLGKHPWIQSGAELFQRRSPDVKEAAVRGFSDPGAVRGAVGFTVHYDHFNTNPELLTLLAEWPGLRVISCHRLNMLRRYLSWLVAQQTGTYVSLYPTGKEPIPVKIDPREMVYDFQQRQLQEARIDRQLRQSLRLTLTYEMLSDHFPETMLQLQRFLNVPVMHLTPACDKLEQRTLREAISNYDELKALLQGSSWAEYFDE